LTTIFPALVVPVIVLGIALEIGKLSGVAFLHNNWKTTPIFIKSYLIIAIMVLMLINSMGIFGLLSKGHIEQEVINTNETANIEVTLSRIEVEKGKIADLNKQIDQIDNALTKMTSQGKAQTVLIQIQSQKKNREALVTQKNTEQTALDGLNTSRIEKEATNKKIEVNFGPLKYLTDIFYTNPNADQLENIVRWIISIIVLVTDPLALVLLVSASISLKNRTKKVLTGIDEKSILHIGDFE
jgi:hypothetical protein